MTAASPGSFIARALPLAALLGFSSCAMIQKDIQFEEDFTG
ncbi:MAG: hypothetical protein ACI80K_001370, partial [Paracoccaceae bacterium]